MDSRDMRAGRAPSAWAGSVVFAGTMAIIAGVCNIIQGLVALFDDKYFVVAGGDLLVFDYTAFLAAYPVWSILIIALDVVVIYALIVHGRELADR